MLQNLGTKLSWFPVIDLHKQNHTDVFYFSCTTTREQNFPQRFALHPTFMCQSHDKMTDLNEIGSITCLKVVNINMPAHVWEK